MTVRMHQGRQRAGIGGGKCGAERRQPAFSRPGECFVERIHPASCLGHRPGNSRHDAPYSVSPNMPDDERRINVNSPMCNSTPCTRRERRDPDTSQFNPMHPKGMHRNGRLGRVGRAPVENRGVPERHVLSDIGTHPFRSRATVSRAFGRPVRGFVVRSGYHAKGRKPNVGGEIFARARWERGVIPASGCDAIGYSGTSTAAKGPIPGQERT